MNRIRAAWAAFRSPDSLTVVVAHDRITTQAMISEDMAREIQRALLRVKLKQGGTDLGLS